MQVGEAFVAVRPDTSKFGPQLTSDVTSAGRKAATSLDDMFSAQTLIGAGAVAGFSRLIGSASDLNEAVNVTGLIFTESQGKIDAFAQGAASALGQSETAARSATATFGGLLQNMGVAEAQSADLSIQLTTLASDLGSAFNKDPEEAVVALSAALRGESEPIRAFNVQLSDMAVRQEAVRLGFAETTAEVDSQGLVQGRLSLIMAQTSAVQGDFANTATGAANAGRILAAEAENSSASIGSNFLPVYENAVAAVRALATGFGALPAPIQTVTVLLGLTAALKGPVGTAFNIMAENARNMAMRFREAGGGAQGMSAAITPGALGTAAAAVGIAVIVQGLADMRAQEDAAAQSTKDLTDAFAEAGAAGQADNLLLQIAEIGPDASAAMAAVDFSARDLADAAAGGAEELRPMLAALVQTGEISAATAVEIGTLAARSSDARGAAADLGTAEAANADAAAENTGSIQDQAAALTEVADSADAARDALDALFGIQRSLDDATTAVQQTADDLTASLRENGHVWDENRQKGRDNTAAAREAALAIAEQTIAFRNNGASVEDATASNRFFIQSLRDQLLAAGLSRQKTEELINTYARVPRKLLTEIDANPQPAIEAVDRAVKLVNAKWTGKTFTATLGMNTGNAVASLQSLQSRANDLLADLGGESGSPGATALAVPAAPTVTVVVQGSVVGDMDRFADEIAYRAAEKLGKAGVG